MKHHCRKVSEEKNFSSKRNFRKIIKLFLTNKDFTTNSDISLKEGNEIIATEKDLAATFNNHHINIMEIITWSKPTTNLHKFCDMDIHSSI